MAAHATTFPEFMPRVPGVPDYSTLDARGRATSIPMWNAKTPDNYLKGPLIQAIQVTIRVWVAKTSLTRQITIAQAM